MRIPQCQELYLTACIEGSMRRILERDLKAEQYRTYRIYEKEL